MALPEVDPTYLNNFDCGKAHLNEFLRLQAIDFHKENLGYTTAVFHQDLDRMAGYFTLSSDAIPLKDSEQQEHGIWHKLSAFPAVKMGRLAVDAEYRRKGIGSDIISLAIGAIIDSRSQVAARFLLVDADNLPAVIDFYEANGFIKSLWAEDQSQHHEKKPKKGQLQSKLTIKMIRDIVATL